MGRRSRVYNTYHLATTTEALTERLIEVVQKAQDDEVTEVTVPVKLIEDSLGEILVLGNK